MPPTPRREPSSGCSTRSRSARRTTGGRSPRDTWGDGQRAGGGVWTQPAIDLDLGLIYFNTGNPSPDYDGSARPGANLFTNSTVALDLETGALRWYYQAIHHDLWDWDHVTGPVLFDVTGADGEIIRGVGSAGKNCLIYLWNRETGEPINPMVETLVPTESERAGRGRLSHPAHSRTTRGAYR